MDIQNAIWQEGWKPTNDIEIGQIMKYYSEVKRETEKIKTNVLDEIKLLEEVGKESEKKLDMIERRISKLCQEYVLNEVDEEDRKDTKTTIKYKLARGEIIIKKSERKLAKPNAEQEAILKELFTDYTKTETVLEWSKLKDTLEIDDEGRVIKTDTKEVVDGVSVLETEQTTNIKLNM